ncbi:hypothetical protein RHGRI_030517 [Rhododendron griersonianum]|uniref:Kelch repeat-containing protein n=1 Tax=Rhododendron griersonianum TaxID=479676 RepID=A0AAV6IQH5_9ERIC|nr:hypothetical protein RHGRI_030517 [Rhododendron griersonianum]
MVMRGGRTKDAFDVDGEGDGEGGGKRSRPSSSDFQELEEEEMATAKETREMREKQRRERKMWEPWGMSEMNFWKMYLMWKMLEEGTGETELREMIETEMWKMERETREMRKVREMETLTVTEMEKSPCLLGRGPEGKGPVLCLFHLEDERKSKRNFCRRCCVEVFGEDEEDEDGKQQQRLPGIRFITPVTRTPERYAMSVVVGTVLYVLGGVFQDPKNEHEWSFHNKVFFFDTNDPQGGWVKGPDMLNSRGKKGKAVAVEGKIYVFGGNNNKRKRDHNSKSRPWAEFLDPITNKWEPLPATPKRSRIHTSDLHSTPVVYGGPGEGKKIFLSKCHHIYHVDAQTWERFHRPESLYPFSHILTSNGNTLYWTTDALFFSFNMKTKDIGCGLVEGYMLSKYRKELLIPEPTLLHLGGDHFCFITLKDLPGDRTKVRCTKFQVSHESHRDGLKASVVCRETYIIGHPLDIDYSYAFVL